MNADPTMADDLAEVVRLARYANFPFAERTVSGSAKTVRFIDRWLDFFSAYRAEIQRNVADAERLEWLMHHTSGKALREIGVNADGANWRDAIDEAIRSDGGWEVDCG